MTTFPEWLEPMAATLTQERFTGPEWLFERKFDGIRLLAFKQDHDVRLFYRARRGAPVSAPCTWKELRTMRDRMAATGDLWSDLRRRRRSLRRAIDTVRRIHERG